MRELRLLSPLSSVVADDCESLARLLSLGIKIMSLWESSGEKPFGTTRPRRPFGLLRAAEATPPLAAGRQLDVGDLELLNVGVLVQQHASARRALAWVRAAGRAGGRAARRSIIYYTNNNSI